MDLVFLDFLDVMLFILLSACSTFLKLVIVGKLDKNLDNYFKNLEKNLDNYFEKGFVIASLV